MGGKKPKKKKTLGDFILTIILLVAICVFCYAAYNLFHIFTEYKKGTDEYNQIEQMAVKTKNPDEITQEEDQQEDITQKIEVPMEVDFAALKAVNDDVIGWIYVEALDGVSYPIVQGSDNSTYLHTTYEGNYNFAGTIFVDYENSPDFSDCNTLVYGHNMKNDSMFGSLDDFVKKEETYAKSKYFWIFTPEADYRYEIVSAYTTSVSSPTYTLFKGPGKEFQNYLEIIRGYSAIDTTVREMTIKDRIVTLSTCTGNSATRFVVQGVCTDTVLREQ